MAKISNTTSYPTKGSPAGTDYVIGTDASSKETKTFTLQSIADLYAGSGSGTVTSVGLSGGTTGLTVTGSPVTSSGTITLAGTLATTNGGTGLTSIGTAGQVLKVNSGATGLEWGIAGGSTSPDSPENSVQFNEAGAFGGSNNFKYTDSNRTLTIGEQDINVGIINIAGGQNGGAGELKFGDNGASGGIVTLKGGDDVSNNYIITLPGDGPSANNKILESDASGNLSWINTPTSGGGTPIGNDTEMQYNNGGSFGGTTGLTWDDNNNILSIATRFEGDIDGALLQKVQIKEVGGVSKGDVVYISGGTGDNPEVKKAQANASITMPALGIMKNNTAEDAIGECVTSGEITGLNLTGFSTGDELFVSSTTAGGFQTSAPTGEANLIQKIAKVIKGGTGGALTVLGAFRTNATPNLNQGNLFIGNASNQTSTLAIGSNNTVLTSNGTTASWQLPQTSKLGFTPLSIYEAPGSFQSQQGEEGSAFSIIRQSVCETDCTIDKVDFFRLAGTDRVTVAVYAGTIASGAGNLVLIGGQSSGTVNQINTITFNAPYTFSAGDDIIILVSLQYATGNYAQILGATGLVTNVNLGRENSIYYQTPPSDFSTLLENFSSASGKAAALHFYDE